MVRSKEDSTVYNTVTAEDMPLVERIANLPEYHDCQRFVVRPPRAAGAVTERELRFGPLVAIWAADSLGVLFPGDQPGQSLALPVAIIHNFDPTPYQPLGLEPGFSCLYIWHEGGVQRHWSARIVPLGPSPSPCQEARDPGALAGGTLTVQTAELPPDVGPADIPWVARFDWDSVQQEQYIGIRCGDQWCEIGNGHFMPSRSALATGTNAAGLKLALGTSFAATAFGSKSEQVRVVGIKGWYDQQRLDMRDQNGNLVITNIVGTVIPHPTLASAKFSDSFWTPVAFINVTDEYHGKKLLLHKGLSTVYMCKGTGEKCGVPPQPSACPTEPANQTPPGETPTPWWSKIVSDQGVVAYNCVIRRTHGGKAMPAAAARWHWSELDATTWVACREGCCTVN
ncbi:MAG TPA: hypothetical protein VFO06_04240 [Gemmatimonadales bacterium]|nr:hypothetical protein [Gemmatimonadales bacterium]